MQDGQIVQELCQQFGVRSALSTPILSADQKLLGFFEIHNKDGGFTDSDREKLLAVSHSAAIAIQNALAYKRLQLTEQTLRESEERFARFMQHLPGLAWIKDRNGRYVFVNDAAERAFRMPRNRLYGLTDSDVFSSKTAMQFQENDRQALLSEGGIQTVETLEHEDGVHHSLVHKFPIFDNRGEVGLIGGMAIDITERIRAEDALRQSEERYRAVVESQAEMVCRFKVEGEIEFANEAYARALGTTSTALLGTAFWNFIPAEERDSVRAMLNRLTPESPEIRIENRFLAQSGEKWTLWTNRALAFDASGRVSEAQATGIDITDRKKAEEALRRANEDLERFAYSASHDLQEPIRNIALSAEVLAHHNRDLLDPNGLARLVFIQESARRMSDLIRDLLAYTQIASTEETIVTETNASTALEKALSSLSAVIIETEAKVTSEPLPVVRIPEIQLQQVFQNLISNAIKYKKDDQKPIIGIRANRQDSDWLFSVQDNGIGIPPEYHERVFGVFKRLHGYGKYAGSGIGLAICKRIVERHGGQIRVESDGRNGSTFYFALPADGNS